LYSPKLFHSSSKRMLSTHCTIQSYFIHLVKECYQHIVLSQVISSSSKRMLSTHCTIPSYFFI